MNLVVHIHEHYKLLMKVVCKFIKLTAVGMENVLPGDRCYVRYKSRGLHPLNGYVWKFLWLYRFQPDFGTHHPDYMYYPLIVPLCINLCINVNVNR